MSFPPDNHSVDRIKFCLARDDDFAKYFVNNYLCLDDQATLEIIEGANVNSKNYKYGKFYLKSIQHFNDKCYVHNFSRIACELLRLNIPTGQFIENKMGQMICDIDHDGQSYYLFVQEFIPGDFFSGVRIEFVAMLEILLKLRNFNFQSKSNKMHSPFLAFNPLEMLDKVQATLKIRCKDDFDLMIKRKLNDIKCIFKQHHKERALLALSVKTVSHYDLHPHNVICRDGKIVSLVDLESFVNIQRELSEAFAIYKFGRKSISKGLLSVEEFKSLVDDKFNLTTLKPYLELELIRRMSLIINLHYNNNDNRWDGDFKKHAQGLKEARVMFG